MLKNTPPFNVSAYRHLFRREFRYGYQDFGAEGPELKELRELFKEIFASLRNSRP